MSLPAIAILCGGVASRLGEIAARVPKSLVPVAGEPFLGHQLRHLAGLGFARAVLLVGHLGDQIRAFAGDGQRFGIQVAYSEDGATRLGTGGAVCKALPLLGNAFFVTYGDSFLEFDARSMWEQFRRGTVQAMMAVWRNRDCLGQSNAVFDGERVRCHDKSATGIAGMEWIDWGVTIFSASVLRDWEAMRPFDLSEITKYLAASGQLGGYAVTVPFHEIGNPVALAATEVYIKAHLLEAAR
jgi:NDP-sugar pyrophosphorylase family protein